MTHRSHSGRYVAAAGTCLLAIVAASAAAAPERAATRAAPTPVKFASSMGRALPTDRGKSEVALTCNGPANTVCRGRVELLPRGAKTKALVGTAPVASRAVVVVAGSKRVVSLPLNARARTAVEDNLLVTTVRLSSSGHRYARAGFIEDADGTKVRPDLRRTHGPPRSGDGVVTQQFNWSWHVNAIFGWTPMPEFRCPGDKKYVETSGNNAVSRNYEVVGKTGHVWFTGDNVSTFDFDTPYTDGGAPDDKHLLGWSSEHNRVWVSGDLHFQLHAVCTSGTSHETAAWLNGHFGGLYLFPWQSK
jgi:hypothetical protein